MTAAFRKEVVTIGTKIFWRDYVWESEQVTLFDDGSYEMDQVISTVSEVSKKFLPGHCWYRVNTEWDYDSTYRYEYVSGWRKQTETEHKDYLKRLAAQKEAEKKRAAKERERTKKARAQLEAEERKTLEKLLKKYGKEIQ